MAFYYGRIRSLSTKTGSYSPRTWMHCAWQNLTIIYMWSNCWWSNTFIRSHTRIHMAGMAGTVLERKKGWVHVMMTMPLYRVMGSKPGHTTSSTQQQLRKFTFGVVHQLFQSVGSLPSSLPSSCFHAGYSVQIFAWLCVHIINRLSGCSMLVVVLLSK